MSGAEQSVTLGSFDLTLVGLSFLISVFGSWCGLTCAARARRRDGAAANVWLAAAAASIGGGAIWAMHFIGMLAYESHVIYTFDIGVTLLSLVAAVASAAAGIALAMRVPGAPGYVIGGIVTGLGVCVMHYTGMAAMQTNGEMDYKPVVVGISIAIAVAAATLALYFALNLDQIWHMLVAAVVMGLGVCAMHYTAMLALVMTPSHHLDMDIATGTNPYSLAMPIFGVSALLLLVVLFAGLFTDAEQLDDTRETRRTPDLEGTR